MSSFVVIVESVVVNGDTCGGKGTVIECAPAHLCLRRREDGRIHPAVAVRLNHGDVAHFDIVNIS